MGHHTTRSPDHRKKRLSAALEVTVAHTPPVPVPAGYKFCFGCSQPLPFHAFHRRADRSDGHGSPCKACVKARRPRYREMSRLYRETCARLSARIASSIPLPVVSNGALIAGMIP